MKNIFVTKPDLPPLSEFTPYLENIWESKWLTNNGTFHQELEEKLCEFLGVEYLSLFSNGTLALITALQALNIKGEVITTPYSFVATTHALWWNNIKPVFVDIEEEYCNIDPHKIESAITSETTAILPVHVYGNPCKLKEIKEIADKYNLKIIYDAAHAFAVRKGTESILKFGNLSILSFHATKTFNTFEGGAIVSPDAETKKKIDFLKNFGFADETSVVGPGINAKMNEFQSAFGLLQLKYYQDNLTKRRNIHESYETLLRNIKGLRLHKIVENSAYNYSYFPIFVEENYGKTRDELYDHLKNNGIYSRRYFYPLISEFSTYNTLSSSNPNNLPLATKIAKQVICLPMYSELPVDIVEFIANLIKFF